MKEMLTYDRSCSGSHLAIQFSNEIKFIYDREQQKVRYKQVSNRSQKQRYSYANMNPVRTKKYNKNSKISWS